MENMCKQECAEANALTEEEILAAMHRANTKPKLTQSQILEIVEEIKAHLSETSIGHWQIESISHLYLLDVPTFEVKFTNDYKQIYCREAVNRGKLLPARTWTYWSNEDFADTHGRKAPKKEEPSGEPGGVIAQATAE